MQIAAIAGFKRSGTRDLGQEPRSALSLVDPILDQAGGRHIVVLLAEFMSGTKFSCELSVVVEKLGQQLGIDAASQVLKEFWPDIKRKLFQRHKDTAYLETR